MDAAGRRYHALNPETFYWAHATFFMLVAKVAEYFCGGLTEAEKRQLFDEHVRWYRMYGMSVRPVPESWEEFQKYWDRVCRDELELNQATLDIFQIRIPKPSFVLMPTPLWDQFFKPLVAGQRWIAAGLLDPHVREKAGMRWTPGDEVLLRLFGKAVELAFLAVPDEIRLHPRALAAYRRAAGRIPANAPLVEAPGFMAPPRDRRGLPMHYFPPHRTIMSELDRWFTPRSRWPACGPAGVAARPPDATGLLEGSRALVEADRRGRRHIQAFRTPAHRDVHPVIR